MIGRGFIILVVMLGFLVVLSSCKQKDKTAKNPPVSETTIPAASPPPSPVPDPAPPPPPPQSAVKPKAQPESLRIAYNGLETFMRGKIVAGDRKEFLVRIRKDQQVNISVDPADQGMLITVLDEQGAAIGNTGPAWQWTTTYAGDLRIVLFYKPDSANNGSKEFTVRVAPY